MPPYSRDDAPGRIPLSWTRWKANPTILYARVSSTEQTIEHQRTQAEQAGFKLDEVIADGGVSGVSTKLARATSRAPLVRLAPQRRHARRSLG